MVTTKCVRRVILIGSAVGALCLGAGTSSAETGTRSYDVAAQDLGQALRTITRESGLELMVRSDLIEGRRAPALKGQYSAEAAINALLLGSGLVAEISDGTVIIRGRSEPPRAVTAAAGESPEIVVTGSRIRGASISSPVMTLNQEDFRAGGQTTLADVARVLPQNFGGGQNPGIGLNVPAGSGGDSSGASTLNLRGLGSDATLTLLNGRRLAYNAQRQSIDISAIPLAAVDRIEVVADGASAVYGSDAVAGVANIILKKEYDGLSTSARFGASTDGGNVQQQYGVLGGSVWAEGGLIAAYEFSRNTPILARHRDYTASRSPGGTLFPFLKSHNALLSAHQEVSSTLSFSVDALYNRRWWSYAFATDARGDYLLGGGRRRSSSRSFAVAPSAKLTLPGAWEVTLLGTYGRDRTQFRAESFSDGVLINVNALCYCNQTESIEINTNGRLFPLPGGHAQAALGAGYRRNKLTVEGDDIEAAQKSRYLFAELSLPIVSPSLSVPYINRLELIGAARYEDYPGIDKVATPKFGVIYAPSPEVEIKGSWGKSFKIPTLYQQYDQPNVALFPAASRGGSGYPPTATAMQILLGNPDLKPERATTWTASVTLRPRFVDGARIEISYFDIAYRDRIVTPIPFTSQALSNPAYVDFVNFAPTAAEKEDTLALGEFFNVTGRPYDPNDVVAIIDNRYRNAARQAIHGVDISGDYRIELKNAASLRLTANATYLHSTQTLSPLQPKAELAGILFSPPHVKARGGAVWSNSQTTISSFINYIGSVKDTRTSPVVGVGSMTTVDLAARYQFTKGALLRGLELALAVHNAFNEKPASIRTTSITDMPYDSTNYSAAGRTVSLGLTKAW